MELEVELEDILSPDEILEIGDAMDKMTDAQLRETLEELIRREVAILNDSRIGQDAEMRDVTRWNVAALLVAVVKVSPKQSGAEPSEP